MHTYRQFTIENITHYSDAGGWAAAKVTFRVPVFVGGDNGNHKITVDVMVDASASMTLDELHEAFFSKSLELLSSITSTYSGKSAAQAREGSDEADRAESKRISEWKPTLG